LKHPYTPIINSRVDFALKDIIHYYSGALIEVSGVFIVVPSVG